MSDETVIVRFVGDPTGYRVAKGYAHTAAPSGWVTATVGDTDTRVRINLDQAYLIEELEGAFVV